MGGVIWELHEHPAGFLCPVTNGVEKKTALGSNSVERHRVVGEEAVKRLAYHNKKAPRQLCSIDEEPIDKVCAGGALKNIG